MLKVKWSYPTIDDWQKEVIDHSGNMILLCGRQVGKSEVMAVKIANYLLNNKKKKLLIVSGVERQASGLYNKTLHYIQDSYSKTLVLKGKNRPLRTKFHMKNGSMLITEPLGVDGSSARQHTVHGVIFEEMQLIPEEAYAAITPMLLTTGGFIWMLGTAWSNEGYAYDRLSDPSFKVFRVNAEEVAEQRPEPQRTIMLTHLERERERLPESQYAQEYLAIPSDTLKQIFPDRLIKRAQKLTRQPIISQSNDYVIGIDPAALGEDEGSITILDVTKEILKQVDHIITRKLYTTETTEKIVDLNRRYDFRKIYIDDGGIGFGVFSELLKHDDTKYKTIPLNNSARPLDYKDTKRKKILRDDMIFNLLNLMEKDKIHLLQDPEIRESLKSYRFEYNKNTKKMIITSNYNHPVQSLMRAAWHAQRKDLKLSVYTIKV